MRIRKKPKTPRTAAAKEPLRRRLWRLARGAVGRIAAFGVALALMVAALGMVERRVGMELAARSKVRWAFVDVPERVRELVTEEVSRRLADLQYRDGMDDRLCSDVAARVADSPWVREVRRVRRLSDGTIRIEAVYLEPFAMIDASDGYVLVDREAVRLPGRYAYHPSWKLVQGVTAAAPEPGRRWEGADLHAALGLLDRLRREPFSEQITAVLVHNFAGRNDPGAAHIELATDRAGGRIRWGSAPGRELVENSVEQKLAILRTNYRLTGRADAGYPVIDVVTFPDRFVVPNAP